MSEKISAEPKPLKHTYRLWFVAGGLLLLAIAIAFIAVNLAKPKRSVAAYCTMHAQEKTRLATLPGDSWPSGVFDDSVGDAGEIANSLGRLEKVAPKELSPSLTDLQKLYQKIDDDPSQAIAAAMRVNYTR